VTARVWLIAVALVALVMGASWWLEHRTQPATPEMVAAAKRDTVLVHDAAKAETVYVAGKAAATITRIEYRTIRDSALHNLADTMLTKRAFAKADTAFVHDTVTLVAADTVLERQKAVTSQVREELAIALRPHPAPRMTTTITGLWDPLAGVPAGSAQVAARLIGPIALLARIDQRVVAGEKAQFYVGAQYTF